MAVPQRLPIVNSDDGVWGDIIRQYLMKEHYNDDTDNAVNGGHQKITIRAGTATAGTAPLKFTSGTLMSSPEAGAVEFDTDAFYFTITTGSVRKKVAIYDDTSGATGDIYYRDSSGNFVRLGIGTTGKALRVSSGIPAWSDDTYATSTKTSNYTITASDTVIFANASIGNVTITLPSESTTVPELYEVLEADRATPPPPPTPPEIVMALPACERVMLLPPASVNVPLEINAPAPAVLPEIVALMRPPLTGGIYVIAD